MKTERRDTKALALREARSLLQRFGFNGFSFRHIAETLGIKAPSLYDHFDSKEHLGNDIVESYRGFVAEWALKVEPLSPTQKVRELFSTFCRFSKDQYKLCPVAVLTADLQTLPKSMRKNVIELFTTQEQWLTRVIEAGMRSGEFARGDAKRQAQAIFAMGLGAQSLARLQNSALVVDSLGEQAIEFLKSKS